MLVLIINIILQLLLAITTIPHIDTTSAPSEIMKLYEQKTPFDKVAELIANQTALIPTHAPTDAEIGILIF